MKDQRCHVLDYQLGYSKAPKLEACKDFERLNRLVKVGMAACASIPEQPTFYFDPTKVEEDGSFDATCTAHEAQSGENPYWYLRIGPTGHVVSSITELEIRERRERAKMAQAQKMWAAHAKKVAEQRARDEKRLSEILPGWKSKTRSVTARCDKYFKRLRDLKVAIRKASMRGDGKATKELHALQSYLSPGSAGSKLISGALSDARDLLWATANAESWRNRQGDRRWLKSEIDKHCNNHGMYPFR